MRFFTKNEHILPSSRIVFQSFNTQCDHPKRTVYVTTPTCTVYVTTPNMHGVCGHMHFSITAWPVVLEFVSLAAANSLAERQSLKACTKTITCSRFCSSERVRVLNLTKTRIWSRSYWYISKNMENKK